MYLLGGDREQPGGDRQGAVAVGEAGTGEPADRNRRTGTGTGAGTDRDRDRSIRYIGQVGVGPSPPGAGSSPRLLHRHVARHQRPKTPEQVTRRRQWRSGARSLTELQQVPFPDLARAIPELRALLEKRDREAAPPPRLHRGCTKPGVESFSERSQVGGDNHLERKNLCEGGDLNPYGVTR
jgi:hypothetical protein